MSAPPGRPIRRLLVANRGEIARRITRSARAMGIAVVAVYAPSDADAPHVTEADEAVALRGTGAGGTYLDAAQLLAAARVSGADAVHPGYGFLSERASFAAAVLDAGLVWVGPPPAAIEAMGDKLAAKRLMAAAGVPVLATHTVDGAGTVTPDGVGTLTPDGVGTLTPDGVGTLTPDGSPSGPGAARLPVIVKAAAGGGGKGMRIVTDPADLAAAVAAAGREAAAAFGDATVFVETYVPDARHVEIQIVADDHGHVVHCFERDCSIQRRHQKIIEEAPSPALDADLRARMGAAAVAAARAVGYRNAGTVEFVVDASGGFWFLEVNTRLQVEHPVTEAVTGIDLVREQLRIAAGLPLSWTQDELRIDGHAVEARLYAEDPAAGFLPATGTLLEWVPPADPAVRWDSGVESGSVVGVEWDPMLAKVIAHAPTREEAAGRLALALERARIRGVTTNRDFLVAALRHPRFLAGEATTAFVDGEDVARSRKVTADEVVVAATAATLAAAARRRAAARVLPGVPGGWRTGWLPDPSVTYETVTPATDTDTTTATTATPDAGVPDVGMPGTVTVRYRERRDGAWDVIVSPGDDRTRVARLHPVGPETDRHPGDRHPGDRHPGDRHAGDRHAGDPVGAAAGAVDLELDGVRHPAHVHWSSEGVCWVQTGRGDLRLRELPRFGEPATDDVAGGLVAPMPGRVIEVAVATGATVGRGDLLVIVEAMKMEHRVTAPHAGTVAAVRVAPGDQVSGGDLLVVVDPAP